MEIVPFVGRANPASARSKVVFPAPLSPRMAWKRPASNSADTPRSAAKRPNCLMTFSTTIVDEILGLASITGTRVHCRDGSTHDSQSMHFPSDLQNAMALCADEFGWKRLISAIRCIGLHLSHAFGRFCRLRSIGRRPLLLRGIFRGAFCLQLFRVKNAISAEAAVGQGL